MSDNDKPNVLCLGVSYPCIQAQLKVKGLKVSDLNSPLNTTDCVVECVQRGVLTQMDGRDLVRCIETEKACGVNVFCVSREQAAVYRTERHLDANFNRTAFVRMLQKHFPEKRFQEVILDWFWIPPGWDHSHWSRSFFLSTLSSLARGGLLDRKGRVFLPFCFHCFKEVMGCFDSLRLYYNVSLVRKQDLSTIALWKGTNQVEARTMQHTFGKRINQEDVYCTFGSHHLQSMDESFVSKRELMDIVDRIDDLSSVRFLMLELLDESCRSSGEKGSFLGLKDCVSSPPTPLVHSAKTLVCSPSVQHGPRKLFVGGHAHGKRRRLPPFLYTDTTEETPSVSITDSPTKRIAKETAVITPAKRKRSAVQQGVTKHDHPPLVSPVSVRRSDRLSTSSSVSRPVGRDLFRGRAS